MKIKDRDRIIKICLVCAAFACGVGYVAAALTHVQGYDPDQRMGQARVLMLARRNALFPSLLILIFSCLPLTRGFRAALRERLWQRVDETLLRWGMIAIFLAPLLWLAFGKPPGSFGESFLGLFELAMEAVIIGSWFALPLLLLAFIRHEVAVRRRPKPAPRETPSGRVSWKRVGKVLAGCIAFSIGLGVVLFDPGCVRPPISINGIFRLATFFGVPALILLRISTLPRPSTHTSRMWGLALVMLTPVPPLLFVIPWDIWDFKDDNGLPFPASLFILPGMTIHVPVAAILIFGWLVASLPLAVFCLPFRFPTMLPILLGCLGITLWVGENPIGVGIVAAIYLAAINFPKHRRIIEFWRPTRLPRISVRGARLAPSHGGGETK